MEEIDFCESETEFDEPWKEHLKVKRKKSSRRYRKRQKTKNLCNQLISCANRKPSIWPDFDWDSTTEQFEYNGRIKRAKHSKPQRWIKKISNRVVRRHSENTFTKKSNIYKKAFDYQWTWI